VAPSDYEAKWRERWEAEGVGRIADLDAVAAGDVFYNLVEFPYPSASGLHVGHVFKYSGADAYGRYQRMRGKAVFQPMGFDAVVAPGMSTNLPPRAPWDSYFSGTA
jgi:leucyl-tRNA synthetase